MFDIGKALPVNDLEVCNRVYSILHVHHIWILKCPTDVENAIHGCNVGQEAQRRRSRGAGYYHNG